MTEQERRITNDLDQKRAARAWEMVSSCKKEYANLVKSAPSLIMNNGLMQTLAFYRSKGETEHGMLCNHICSWVGEQIYAMEEVSFETLMPKLYNSTSLNYRRATEEALAFLRWVRQFAAAVQKMAKGGQ